MRNKISSRIKIGSRFVGEGYPTYIICEVGSNIDGNLKRAKRMAKLARDLGADAYKIQSFTTEKIVSKVGFTNLQISFQSRWDKPVVEVYKKAETPKAWILEISEYCKKIGIDFFSSPTDIEAVDLLEKVNPVAHKIGSGEIDNFDFLEHLAKTNKPLIISCGSSTLDEIDLALKTVRAGGNKKIVLLQCVTNYPSSISDANIKAMIELGKKFNVLVGYSDHSIGTGGGGDDPLNGITVPIAAVALGAHVIEKHFTDDRKRKGPDHSFAMDPDGFKKMVDGIRAVEKALGDGRKRLMPSEKQTVIIQRRGIYAFSDIKKGEKLTREKIIYLRPALGLRPIMTKAILGKVAKRNIFEGEVIKHNDF